MKNELTPREIKARAIREKPLREAEAQFHLGPYFMGKKKLMERFKWLFVVLLLALARPLAASDRLSENQAIDHLAKLLTTDHVYDPACIRLETEDKDAHNVSIAVRERHGEYCPGDPETSPVAARFRVSVTKGTITWYDAANDAWKSYQLFLKNRLVFAGEIQSQYSDLTDKVCKATHEAKPVDGDYAEWECPGVPGYALKKLFDDGRENLSVVHAGKTQDLNLFNEVTGRFNHLAEKAEWRIQDQKPAALIVRMIIMAGEENPPKERQVLIVSKISPEQSCVVKVIDASKEEDANTLARAAADQSQGMKCLW